MDSLIATLERRRRDKLQAKKENDGKDRNFRKLKVMEKKGLGRINRKRIKRDAVQKRKKIKKQEFLMFLTIEVI